MDDQSPQLFQQIALSRSTRIELARKSHRWFFGLYLPHYISYPAAPCHRNFFNITENDEHLAVIVAFRGSSKSTIFTLSFPIWSIIGVQQRKFVLILSQTQAQARQHMTNLKQELETNQLLRADFGAFEEDTDQWGLSSLVIPKYGARITVASSEQSIRGLRNRQYRPDLIICDDVEDLNSVKTKEGRDKAFAWLTGEVFPAGDRQTKIIVIGNLLHEDSLLMRLNERIEHGDLAGKFYWYPLVTDDGVIGWPGKFPNMASIEQLRNSIPSEVSWQREFLLKIVADQEQVVHPSWINYYDQIPSTDTYAYKYTAVGIDLAISQKQTADYTAMVTGMIFGREKNMRIYILPNPVNERLTFPQQVERAKLLQSTLGAKLFIEDVAFQGALEQQLKHEGFVAEGVKVRGLDKRARLAVLTSAIQTAQILFPKVGAEQLIRQMTGFGKESHDDLVDAFTILASQVMQRNRKLARAFKKPVGW